MSKLCPNRYLGADDPLVTTEVVTNFINGETQCLQILDMVF
jgi:hypothetical protein